MQSLSVKKSLLKSTIEIPASKSYANRALIVAAISPHSPKIFNLPDSTDVINLISALKQIGLKTDESGGLQFLNSFPDCETSDQKIEIGDGGTTARFIAAMLLLGKKSYALKLGGRLKDRPWDEFISIARNLGAKAELQNDILSIQGPAKFPMQLKVDCARTTQFATAFALITPSSQCEIQPVNLSSSQSYWEMTRKIIGDLNKAESYFVPRDWSSASYPLAFGALNQEIKFPGLHPDLYQADAKFFNILKSLGCAFDNKDGIVVTKIKTSGNQSIDVSDCLDLVPTLGFFLSHLVGQHTLTGIGNLAHKESDRLSEVISLLKNFGRNAFVQDGKLIIEGTNQMVNQAIDLVLPDDHRMVMAGTLFLLHHEGGSVSPKEAVKKSYPDFFSIIGRISE